MGVPFSWDRTPSNTGNTYQTPPTPPPSSRWLPSAIEGDCADIQLLNDSLAETMEGLGKKCNTCSNEQPNDANQSPDFIIQGFLPDTQVLAASSLAQKKLIFSSSPNSKASFSRLVDASNVKGCSFCSLYHSLVKPKGRTPTGACKSDGTKDSTNRPK